MKILILLLIFNFSFAANFFSKKEKPKTQKSTIKTLPENSEQKLALPKESPFFTAYALGISNALINQKAWHIAFTFLEKNHKELQKEGLCLQADNINNRKKIRNLNCLVIADYTKSKLEKRLHIVKLDSNKIYSLYTAHGKGSNLKEKDLVASLFSNKSGSLKTSIGFYLTDTPYNSSKNTFGEGPNNGIKLDGLNCTNNNARKRYIVMHTAKYVSDTIKDNESIGYSEGCITLPPSQKDLMNSCAGGALVYTHGNLNSK